MRTRELQFYSDGTRLDGLLQLPDETAPDRRHAVLVLCSGFQGLKELIPAKLWGPLTEAGYACFSFDYRGFGTSDGPRGRVLPREQVEDVRNAITFLQQQPELDPGRIALIGWGLGGGIVVQAGAEDTRVGAVVCLNGVGDGGRAVRATRPYADWLALQDRIADDRVGRVLTGRSALVSPWEVVPLDPPTRENVAADMYGNHPRFGIDVTLQSAEAYYAFRPELVAHRISPRPLLIVHGARNALHPIDEARNLYARARHPKALIELPDAQHLDWIQPTNPHYSATLTRIIDWLKRVLSAECRVPRTEVDTQHSALSTQHFVSRRAYEVIVVGCGGIGSAAAYWLARQAGSEVLAIEQFALGHDRGSSQDHSRIIRRSYHDPHYTALATPAYDLWSQVEAESGVQLVVKTGGLDLELMGTTGSKDLAHCAAAMAAQGVPFEELSAHEVMARWPQFRLPDAARGLYQADSGLVDARKANAVHVALARLHGATIRDRLPVRAIRPTENTVEVVTDEGVFTAVHLVLACGAWTNDLLGHLGLRWPLTITQEQVTYFATPHLREFAPDRFPIWIWRAPEEFYGFPVYGEVATKAGQDVGGDEVTAAARTFEPNPRTRERLVRFLETYIPRFVGPELYTKTCLYTMPPDRDFVIDTVPGYPQITVAADAAHAFKFATLIGRILGELALDGRTEYPIAPFRADRPAITDPTFRPTFRNEAVLSRS